MTSVRLSTVFCFAAFSACGVEQAADRHRQPCSTEWFQFVEDNLSTGDSYGHGPDLGSTEWRSVVEFKLGIRDDPTVPESDSEQWCIYIDKQLSDGR